MKNWCNEKVGYFFLRLTLGLNLVTHGLIRFPDMNSFTSYMVESTTGITILPKFAVIGFAYGLTIVEFTAGLMLILGFKTRCALIAWSATLCILMFGTCMAQKWDVANAQMLLALVNFVLFLYLDNDTPLTCCCKGKCDKE